MEHYERQPRSHGVQFALTVLACLLVVVVYLAAMNALVDVSVLDGNRDIEQRDEVYTILHVGLLIAAGIIGFLLGKWLNGQGLAYSLLFVILIAISMMVIQLGSYELACHGYNDLVRHWEC